MPLPVIFLADAAAELDEAVACYDCVREGLGSDFAVEIEAGLRLIQEYPRG